MRGSMLGGAVIAGMVSVAGVVGADAAETGVAVEATPDEPRQAASAVKGPFIKQSKRCGDTENGFFCGQVRTGSNLYLEPYGVKFAAKGKALVTWQGSVFCEFSSRNLDRTTTASSILRYAVYFGLVTSADEDIRPNDVGVASVGEALSIFSRFGPRADVETRFLQDTLRSVSLSKLYDIKKTGDVNFQVLVKPDFSSAGAGSPYCNIYGDTTTVQFLPD